MVFTKMNVNLVRMLAVVVTTVTCVFNASATLPPDVSYTIGGTSDLQQFNIEFDNKAYNNVYAGGEQISQTGSKDASLPNNYISLCTDFLGSLYVGKTYQYDGQAVPIASGTIGGIAPGWSSAESFTLASYLFNTDGDLGSGGLGTGNKAGISVEDMAALQLAVWIVLYDSTVTTTTTKGKTTTTTTVNDGSGAAFQVTGGSDSGAIALALSEVKTACAFVNGLTGNYNGMDSLLVPDAKLGYQGNADNEDPQELMYSSVPEPATILAGVLLLLPLGVSTIRNLRKSQVK